MEEIKINSGVFFILVLKALGHVYITYLQELMATYCRTDLSSLGLAYQSLSMYSVG